MAITEAVDACQGPPDQPSRLDIALGDKAPLALDEAVVSSPPLVVTPETAALGEKLYKTQKRKLLAQTDRLFAWLMVFLSLIHI